jgi:hypothetical protein
MARTKLEYCPASIDVTNVSTSFSLDCTEPLHRACWTANVGFQPRRQGMPQRSVQTSKGA